MRKNKTLGAAVCLLARLLFSCALALFSQKHVRGQIGLGVLSVIVVPKAKYTFFVFFF